MQNVSDRSEAHEADEQQQEHIEAAQVVEPGMAVKTTAGDLGEQDVSAPRVTGVIRDARGLVEKIIVRKGLVFRKELVIPAQRVEAVDQAPVTEQQAHVAEAPQAMVTVEASEAEVERLSAVQTEELPPQPKMGVAEQAHDLRADSLLEEVEEEIPTVEGVRRLEGRAEIGVSQQEAAQHDQAGDRGAERDEAVAPPKSIKRWLHVVGPGFLGGMAGNDSSAVTSYAVNGATNGYGQLWLLLLATPLLQATQYACAKIGRVTQEGLAEVLRKRYGRGPVTGACLLLLVANLALIAADLVAVGSGLQLLTGIAWEWFVAPVALALWYVTVYQNFNVIQKIFVVLSLAFVTYFITGIFSGANWGAVLHDTFIPQVTLSFAGISSAVALLGATVSPYTMFWQAQGEKEQKRPGSVRQQTHMAALDIGLGSLSGNLIAYFIIVSTSATLFTHHQRITTAADAAHALQPLLGPFASALFALGLIGAGLVAIPVLLASTAYAVTGAFGWSASLWKKPWQNEGFYLILTLALAISLAVALLGIDPIQLIFWANVLQGVLAPVMVVMLLVIGNSRRVMGGKRLGTLTNVGLVVTAALMFAATTLLFIGLASGQGG